MVFDDRSPIYLQIAEQIKNDIVTGALAEDEQVMSTNQYAAFYRINPATAAKGFAQLVDEGVLYKKRGIGMFVSPNARDATPHRPARLVLRRRGRPDDPRGQGDRRTAQGRPPAHPHLWRRLMTIDTDTALTVHTENLTVRFAGVPALDRLDLRLAPGKIHGLLGRNGSGKSTLAAVLAGFRRPDEGRVLIEGGDLGTAQQPYENAVVTSRVCLIRESGDLVEQAPVRHAIGLAASLRPYWDDDLANDLLDRFEIPLNKKIQKLSRGKKSALGVVLGLASRAPLTIFDESYLGMDVPSRALFYDALLADYTEVPRTIVLSTHLVSEVSTLLEEVVILDNGRLVTQSPVDALRGRGAAIVGPAAAVDKSPMASPVLAAGAARRYEVHHGPGRSRSHPPGRGCGGRSRGRPGRPAGSLRPPHRPDGGARS